MAVFLNFNTLRRILIENPTGFAVRWSFSIQEIPIKCFSFDPEQGGTLEPYSSQPLDISYEASLKASTAQCRLTFKCSDAEGIANSSEVKFLASEQQLHQTAKPFFSLTGLMALLWAVLSIVSILIT